jgi:hypothetical protein
LSEEISKKAFELFTAFVSTADWLLHFWKLFFYGNDSVIVYFKSSWSILQII